MKLVLVMYIYSTYYTTHIYINVYITHTYIRRHYPFLAFSSPSNRVRCTPCLMPCRCNPIPVQRSSSAKRRNNMSDHLQSPISNLQLSDSTLRLPFPSPSLSLSRPTNQSARRCWTAPELANYHAAKSSISFIMGTYQTYHTFVSTYIIHPICLCFFKILPFRQILLPMSLS
jgi:hypothetical protein